MYHIHVSLEWNRMVDYDKKWLCILSAYSQFEITCWDFNDHYIWKFSLLLYLIIVHIYIMLNKKFNLFCLSLSYPITYSIYLFRYFHSLFCSLLSILYPFRAFLIEMLSSKWVVKVKGILKENERAFYYVYANCEILSKSISW